MQSTFLRSVILTVNPTFIKDTFSIKTILSHLGEASEAPKLYPPRGPPEDWDVGEEFPLEPDSDYQYDQTVDW